METETKLNFVAIISGILAVLVASIAFTPIGGLIMAILILTITPNIRSDPPDLGL